MSILQLRIVYMIIDRSDYFYVALLCCRQAEEARKNVGSLLPSSKAWYVSVG